MQRTSREHNGAFEIEALAHLLDTRDYVSL